jgi:hypothetical protein
LLCRELKSERGRVTKGQARLLEEWQGRTVHTGVLRSTMSTSEILNSLRGPK